MPDIAYGTVVQFQADGHELLALLRGMERACVTRSGGDVALVMEPLFKKGDQNV